MLLRGLVLGLLGAIQLEDLVMWFVAVWVVRGEVVNRELMGPFDTHEARSDAIEGLEGDEPGVFVIPIDVEGVEDSNLYIGDAA
jgi:hypothetical protein